MINETRVPDTVYHRNVQYWNGMIPRMKGETERGREDRYKEICGN
jgi:hypothetical protein